MSSMARFSSWNVNLPTLRTMPAINWFTASDRGCPSDQAGASTSPLFSTPRNPFASSLSAPATEVAERVQRVPDDQPHSGERGV